MKNILVAFMMTIFMLSCNSKDPLHLLIIPVVSNTTTTEPTNSVEKKWNVYSGGDLLGEYSNTTNGEIRFITSTGYESGVMIEEGKDNVLGIKFIDGNFYYTFNNCTGQEYVEYTHAGQAGYRGRNTDPIVQPTLYYISRETVTLAVFSRKFEDSCTPISESRKVSRAYLNDINVTGIGDTAYEPITIVQE